MENTSQLSLNKSISKFYRIFRLDRKDISSIYIFALLAGLVQLSLPLGIQTIISFVMAGSVSTSIVVLILMVLIGTFLNGLLQVRQLQVIEKLKQKIFLRYSMEFSRRLPHLDIEKLDKYYLPELVNRYFDTFSLQNGIEKLLIDFPSAIIQIILGLTLLSFYHSIFIGFGVLLILILFLILRATSPRALSLAVKSSDYKYEVASWLQETARLVKSFKYAKGKSLQLTKTDALVTGYLESRTEFFKVLILQFWSLISFKMVITAAMLIVGTILLVNQQINVGQFIAADIVIIAIMNSVEKLIISLDKVYEGLVSVEKLAKVAEAPVEENGTIKMIDNGKGMGIEFSAVSFGYGGLDNVIENLSFTIKPGEIVHIKGDSGSGKSTILRLLTGSFHNYNGSVLVDGLPISNYELDSLRSQTGVLLSSQDIFSGTLHENISFGNEAVTVDEIMALAKQTGLDQFIQSSQDGLNTHLDPVGKRLPRHLRLRILLMRALLGKQRLLLLEEPFQYLDPVSKDQVIRLMNQGEKLTVLIASEDDMLPEYCDQVILLKNHVKN